MAVSNDDYATLVTALRECLRLGTGLTGVERKLALDVLLHAVNTLDGNTTVTTANTDADALEVLLVTLAAAVVTENTKADDLEALLVTHFAILVADGVAPTQAHVDDMVAACATPRSDLVTATTALVAAKDACTTPRATLVTSMNAAVAAGGTAITNITASDFLDGNET